MADVAIPVRLPLGLVQDDIDTLALELCRGRQEHPEGGTWGDRRYPGGITFLEIARRDVRTVLEALAAMPAFRTQ